MRSPSVPSAPADAVVDAAHQESEQPECDRHQQHNPKDMRREAQAAKQGYDRK
jgi:hypothetical protein